MRLQKLYNLFENLVNYERDKTINRNSMIIHQFENLVNYERDKTVLV